MGRILKWCAWLILALVGFVIALQIYFFGMIGWWRDHNPETTSFMREALSELREKSPNAELSHHWVPYRAISDNLKRAVITSEDASFTEHNGVDWDAIEKAYENNQKRGKKIKGGSTITQQLAKNLFLSGERSYLRKAQELVIAYMLEFWMSKERILEIYLNVVEWGNGVFGAEAAAEHYYGVSAAQLSSEQAARLAVMLPNPRVFDRNRNSSYLARRSNTILRWMPDVELP
ncbi:MAG: monofunctional biosynthetic peptidoglycan transglycosylase [Burkholderiaceae bacterium]